MHIDYNKLHEWQAYYKQLPVEYRQSMEEGLDIEAYKDLFDAVDRMPNGPEKVSMADAVFQLVTQAPIREGYPYVEPSDLAGIQAARKPYSYPTQIPTEEVLREKIRGAWLGRICGCMLGKTVEGIRTNELIPLLKDTGNYPMYRYILRSEITPEILERTSYDLANRPYADEISCMPFDDDTNYTALAQVVIDKYGRDFTPADMAQAWQDLQPVTAYCTAERVAMRNFINGYFPPFSAVYKNPYREWIGAQIRADYFGYINPGNPELAADMAWRDASISHIKNGIYGEMWAAAMIAAAAVNNNIEDVIRAGLAEIPAKSRLYEEVTEVIDAYNNGRTQEEAFAAIHARYDEHNSHDWCHTISNALIVAASLLYGQGDYGKSICMAVETGFDTDCNGATVGSILGMMGTPIGEEWTAPIHDLLETTIFGVGTVSIAQLVAHTMDHIQ